MPLHHRSIFRGIDANLNRANEAFRVLEDALRFGIEDASLTRVCKQLRHDLADWAKRFELADLVLFRDASGDVGRSNDIENEYRRSDIHDILRANLARAKQSLRTLEEFSKTFDDQSSMAVEKIRYRVYDLEKAVLVLFESHRRLGTVQLYVLTDSCGDMSRFEDRIGRLTGSGVGAIQLRDKSLEDRELARYGETLVRLTRPDGVLSIINDRVDIASAVNADGVHLGQSDLPVAKARSMLDAHQLIGVSTHNLQQAREAMLAGANYIGVGPTFPSGTKSFDRFTGVPLIRDVLQEVSLPVFAIGGIDLARARSLVEIGCQRIAVSGAILADPKSMKETIAEFTSILQGRLEIGPGADPEVLTPSKNL